MLTKRIIPCLDVRDGRVVKGVNFIGLQDAGCPVENALFYDAEGADELVFLDITASYERRNIILEVVRRTASNIFMPLTVGGGIVDLDNIKQLLRSGADKVSINTTAVSSPEIINKSSDSFGSQCIVVAIDAKLVEAAKAIPHSYKHNFLNLDDKQSSQNWEVYIHGGRTPTGCCAVCWAKEAEQRGAGEILLTSMDFDGTKKGYDIELTRTIAQLVNIPVIASGGAGIPEHLYQALAIGQASAVLAASIFHYREYRINEVKKFLKNKGVEVRL
ncbi:MAG: imidazole glycerol phosphate synthase subunit HisF [Candidatus Omnitrophota bacterium]